MSSGTFWLALQSLALALAIATCASAQGLEGSSDEWIDRAIAAYNAEQWTEAYSAFKRAHAIEPSARALRGMGVASYRMGHYGRALFVLQLALREPAKPLDDRLRQGVEQLLVELESRVGRCVVTANVERPQLAIDGTPAVADDEGRLLVDSGPHTLTVVADGYEPASIAIDVASGVTQVVPVELIVSTAPSNALVEVPAPAAPALQPAEVARAVIAPPQSEHVQVRDGWHALPWVLAASVPVLALGTGLAWYRTQQIGDDLVAHCKRAACSDPERNAAIAASPLSTFETLTNVGWALTGVAVVATCVSFVIGEPLSASLASARLKSAPTQLTVSF